MPRYFFHRSDASLDMDTEGTELKDEREARSQAVFYAGELLREDTSLTEEDDLRIEVADEAGRLLFTVVTTAIRAA